MTQLGVFTDTFYNSSAVLPQSGIATTAQNGGVAPATLLVGAQDQYAVFSGQAGAQAITLDSAANIIASLQNTLAVQNQAAGNAQGVQPAGVPNLTLLSYTLTIVNNNTAAGIITLTTGAGVTLTAGAAIAITTSVTFVVKVTSPTTVSITRVASGAV